MELKTYAEVSDKVRSDLGLQQEDFVTSSEMMGYCNDGINDIESTIIKLYEDYFLAKSTIDLVAGQEEYDLPSDIFATKIRGIIYKENDTYYPVSRIRDFNKFLDIIETKYESTDANYRYIITNNASSGIKLQLLPAARMDLTGGLHIWYTRNANRITAETDTIDIPEYVSYVEEYMKMRCYEKEGHPNYGAAVQRMEMLKNDLRENLKERFPDYDNELEADMTFYQETV